MQVIYFWVCFCDQPMVVITEAGEGVLLTHDVWGGGGGGEERETN